MPSEPFADSAALQNPDEQQRRALEDIDVVLDRNRPRHVLEGIGSGLGFVVAGAVGACGILVLSPHVASGEGAAHGGKAGRVVGGAVGAAVGIGSAASVAAGGLLSGAGQIVRGVLNTPSSIVEPRRGKWWSVNDGRWVKTHLKSEQEWIDRLNPYDEDLLGHAAVPEEIQAERRRDDGRYQRAKEFGVHDTELYDLMGIDPDATTEDIHRRFAQLGKIFNPNRAGANTSAARDRLEQISTAYAILTNPRLRERYDREGIEALASGRSHRCAINPVQLYATLYGSEKFDPYVGRLAAASEALAGQERSAALTLVDARELQRRRVTRLALQLARRLKPWVDGDRDAAQTQWKLEALELCETNYGVELVHLVGSAYSLSAAQFLGSFDSGIGMPSIRRWAHKQRIALQQSAHQAAQKVGAFAGDSKKASLQNEAIELLFNEASDDELFHRIGRDVLELLWTRTAVDVTATIHETAQMVLFDQDLNDDTRKLRGEGLEVLGQIFQDAEYERSAKVAQTQSEYERIAFCAVLETIRNQEVATANAPIDVN